MDSQRKTKRTTLLQTIVYCDNYIILALGVVLTSLARFAVTNELMRRDDSVSLYFNLDHWFVINENAFFCVDL